MRKPKVYIARTLPKEVEVYLGEHCECRKWEGSITIDDLQLREEIQDAEGLLTGGSIIDAHLLDSAPCLRVVSSISVGYNNMDIPAMKKKNVIGTNAPSVADDSVADLVMGLMLASARRITELDRYVKEGHWKNGDDSGLFGTDVHHAKLGIVGMGRIGEVIAKRARFGFDMDVLYHNRSRKRGFEEKTGVVYSTLDELLRQSDFVVLMMSLSDATKDFMNAPQFALMKPTAFLINTSRGPVVNEEALIEALRNKIIYGAALDVFNKEPVDPNHPLLSMENVITLPHISAKTRESRYEKANLAARNLVAALRGEVPPDLIDEFK